MTASTAPATAELAPGPAYRALEARFRRIGLIGEAAAMLGWDTATTTPPGSAAARAEQAAALSLTSHEQLTDPALGELLARAGADNALTAWQRANLAEMARDYRHATAVPADLVEAASKAASACEHAWRRARQDNDFAGLKPLLAEVLRLVRETAAAKAAAFGCSPYDALLDQYEPGGRAADIDRLFDEIGAELPELTGRAIERQAAEPPPLPLEGPFPVEAQTALGVTLMERLGFDFERGRLDISHHPFCGGVPDDVRITTRYDEADFTSALMGVLHETGHALYQLNLPKAWRQQPVGNARGMSLHESQSLFVEMQVCRSAEFAEFAAPLIREAFGRSGPAFEAANLYRHGIRVERSLIRVDADELTYPAHVILRYRLERALIAGDLDLDDLPGAWSDGMQQLVGVRPPDDRLGCLQDIHWPSGAWGYFPTYTLGAMTAAQLFQSAASEIPGLGAQIAAGEFATLVGWLKARVHEPASSLSTSEIIAGATGRPLESGPYLRHLKRRYLS